MKQTDHGVHKEYVYIYIYKRSVSITVLLYRTVPIFTLPPAYFLCIFSACALEH